MPSSFESTRMKTQRSNQITSSTARLLLSVLDVDGLPDPVASWVESRSDLIFERHFTNNGFLQTRSPCTFFIL